MVVVAFVEWFGGVVVVGAVGVAELTDVTIIISLLLELWFCVRLGLLFIEKLFGLKVLLLLLLMWLLAYIFAEVLMAFNLLLLIRLLMLLNDAAAWLLRRRLPVAAPWTAAAAAKSLLRPIVFWWCNCCCCRTTLWLVLWYKGWLLLMWCCWCECVRLLLKLDSSGFAFMRNWGWCCGWCWWWFAVVADVVYVGLLVLRLLLLL